MTEGPSPAALSPTALIDSDHPAVVDFARRHAVGNDDRARAVALTYAVRDGFRYDPYRIDLSTAGMRASRVLDIGVGWCVTKAALLCAAARAVGLPARVGYADVRNHLSTERMRQTMKTDLFVWHGYTELWIEGRWVKATPAFNIELCERFGLLPLDFDGEHDSLYHPFDKTGQRHMEYVREHGSFDDMPLARIVADFRLHYPGTWRSDEDREGESQIGRQSRGQSGGQSGDQSDGQDDLASADFEADVARETAVPATSSSTAPSAAAAPSAGRAPGEISRA